MRHIWVIVSIILTSLFFVLGSCSNIVMDKFIYPYLSDNGKWGYINKEGEIIIDAKYKLAYHFTNGVAIVLTDSGYNYINVNDEFISTNNFSYAKPFAGNFGIVYTKDSLDGEKQFVINKRAELLFEKESSRRIIFFNKYGLYESKDTTYVIDTFGKVQNVFSGTPVCRYNRGSVIIKNKKGMYCIDTKQKFISDSIVWVNCLCDDLFLAKIGNNVIVFDEFLTPLDTIPNHYRYSSCFFDGKIHFSHKVGDRRYMGFMNRKGKEIINPQYIDTGFFSEEKASACMYDTAKIAKWGFIDTTGAWIIAPVFDAVWSEFCNGIAIVKKGSYWGYIDKRGNWIIKNKLGEYGQDIIASTHLQYINYVPCNCRF